MKKAGRLWIFGDDVDTDVLAPGRFLHRSIPDWKMHVGEAVHRRFGKEAKPGDIVLAGNNFGCGSSREQAPRALQELGIGCVIARSFARLFYRNSIAIGLPVATLEDTELGTIEELEPVEVDLAEGRLHLAQQERDLRLRRVPPEILELVESGGVLPLLKRIGDEQAREDGA